MASKFLSNNVDCDVRNSSRDVRYAKSHGQTADEIAREARGVKDKPRSKAWIAQAQRNALLQYLGLEQFVSHRVRA